MAAPTVVRAHLVCGLGAWVLLAGALPAVAATYNVDPHKSELVVRLFKAGAASGLAHNHVIKAGECGGTVEIAGDAPEQSRISVSVQAASLQADLPEERTKYKEPPVSDKDRSSVQSTMLGPGQLDAGRFPVIRFSSTEIRSLRQGVVEVTGVLELHGKSQTVTFPAEVSVQGGVFHGTGALEFKQSEFGIHPYSAFLGAVRNEDKVRLIFDIVAEQGR